MVRRAWIALAAVVVAEAVLWTLARFIPLEAAPVIGAAIPVIGVLALLVAVVQARPSLGETALAVDAEGGLGDRVSSALELAVGFPASATPPAEDASLDVPHDGPFDEAVEADRFVRRQRRDALAALRTVPSLFKPRFSRSPALASHGFGRAPRGGPSRAESPGPGDRPAARRARGRRPSGRPARRARRGPGVEGRRGRGSADRARRGAARAGSPAARAAGRARGEPAAARRGRERSPLPHRSVDRTARVGDDVTGALAVAGREREPGGESRRRPGEDPRGPRRAR